MASPATPMTISQRVRFISPSVSGRPTYAAGRISGERSTQATTTAASRTIRMIIGRRSGR